jgi:hypothetical protein
MIPALLLLWGSASAFAAEPFKFDLGDLERLLESRHVSSVEQLLAALPPELTRNFVALTDSDSLQAASPLDPRVIVWSTAGGFAMTFNGNPAQAGHEGVELFQFLPEEQRFHFHRVKFAGSYQLEEPPVCLSCHGREPRPIWSEYPDWTGTFGSFDDALVAGSPEAAAYQAFRAHAQSHARYRYLFPEDSDPLARPEFPFRSTTRPGPSSVETSLTFRPNLKFGSFVARLNALRAARIAKPSTELLRAALGCPGAAAFSTALGPAGLQAGDLDPRFPDTGPRNAMLNADVSYFDGNATSRELFAARLLEASHPELAGESERFLALKYAATTPPDVLDAPVIAELDRYGGWIPLPYAETALTARQKREPFRGGFAAHLSRICAALSGL